MIILRRVRPLDGAMLPLCTSISPALPSLKRGQSYSSELISSDSPENKSASLTFTSLYGNLCSRKVFQVDFNLDVWLIARLQ